MQQEALASFYHIDTTDLALCKEVASTVQAIISGLRIECFQSQNGAQVIFHCIHPSTLTRSSAIMLIKQFLSHHMERAARLNYENMRVIAIANEKGGVAKTTSCLNIAASLAMRERKVLLIDLDAQANATLGLGYDPAFLQHKPEDLLNNPLFPLQQAIVQTDIPNLDLIPAAQSLHEANMALVRAVGRELKLRNKLVNYVKGAGANGYDYILIDSPPAADILTLNVLMAATHLIVPVQASYYSLSAMGRLGTTIDSLYEALDPRVQLLGILVTMYNGANPAQRAVYELLNDKVRQEFGDYLFAATIDHSDSMNESEASQRPIVVTHPESAAAAAYHQVAEEVLLRLENNSGPIEPILSAASDGDSITPTLH